MSPIKVALKPYYNDIFLNNNVFRFFNGHNYLYELDTYLSDKKIECQTIDRVQEADVYLYVDVPYPWQTAYWKNILANRDKSILICVESPLVNPFNHFRHIHNLFKKVYTWNDEMVNGINTFKIMIPQMEDLPYSSTCEDSSIQKLAVMVNSNKISPFIFKVLSKYSADYYSERVQIIKYFDAHLDDFDLFGNNWGQHPNFSVHLPWSEPYKPKTFKGPVAFEKKLQVLGQYKFNFSFENTAAPGYITEKIFDSFKAGVVPIYKGAPNITDFISEQAFINAHDYKNIETLHSRIRLMSTEERMFILEQGKKVLTSENYLQNWGPEKFRETIHQMVISLA